MANVESFLWQVVSEVEPTQSQKDGAKRSHNYLRSLLQTGQMANRIIDDYLSGSYARDTAVRPLDDVDIIFIVKPDSWSDSWGRPHSYAYLPEPSKILDSFANAIRYRYPVSSVYGQRRSVRLNLEHLDIDVVPAVYVGNDPKVIKVPDTSTDQWILSAPKKHEEVATLVNKQQNGLIKPLIKLLKFWNNNLPSTTSLKSFAIETTVLRIFQTINCNSLQQGLLIYFDFFAYVSGKPTSIKWTNTCGMDFSWLVCNIPDVSGTASNIAHGVELDRKQKFLDAAVRSRDKILEANNTISNSIAIDKMSEALRIK